MHTHTHLIHTEKENAKLWQLNHNTTPVHRQHSTRIILQLSLPRISTIDEFCYFWVFILRQVLACPEFSTLSRLALNSQSLRVYLSFGIIGTYNHICSLVYYCSFETGSHCVTLAYLEFALSTRLALNSQR